MAQEIAASEEELLLSFSSLEVVTSKFEVRAVKLPANLVLGWIVVEVSEN
jgi:hypothetical protein